tara:strand:- start:1185 stop:2063 length:879 start_codon:yes stop_codon:yes gene_type:complete
MKIYGGDGKDWGGWDPKTDYPWYSLDFKSTKEVRSIIFNNLRNDKIFSFVRFGDGPLGYVDDMNHRWHPKDEKIKNEFIKNFKKIDDYNQDDFMVGIPMDTPIMSDGLISPITSIRQCWKSMNKYLDLDRKYFAHNAIHSMFVCEYKMTVDFLNLVKSKKVCIVGNERYPIEVLNYLYGDVHHVKVPYINAFYSHERITNEVIKQQKANNFDVILFAASFATYPTMVSLFEKLNNSVTMIDIGSTIDPFVNDYYNIRATPQGNVVTHSGKRGWWITDYTDFVRNIKKVISDQ